MDKNLGRPQRAFNWVAYRRRKRIIRTLLNLAVLGGLGVLAGCGYLLFTHSIAPLMGSAVFILGVAGWVLLVRLLRCKYGRAQPSFKLTAFSAVAIVLVLAFAGVQPMATCKDRVINNTVCAVTGWWSAWGAARAEQGAQREMVAAQEEEQSVSQLEDELFRFINAVREEHGQRKLVWDSHLATLARWHSEYMASSGCFEHSAYNYYENIYQGTNYSQNGGARVVNGWLASPGHRANLLRNSVAKCGIGIAASGSLFYVTFIAD